MSLATVPLRAARSEEVKDFKGKHHMRAPVKRILFWTVMVTLATIPFVVAEAYLRFLGLGDPVLYDINDTYRYSPRPNQRTNRFGSAMITIDRYGLRSADDWDDDSARRILFIGDSVTYGGRHVDDSQTFAHLTGVLLEEQTGEPFTCGNAGVNGYGIDNMTARLRYGIVDNEDIIVVTLITWDTTRGLAHLWMHPFFNRRPPRPLKAIWEAAAVVMFRLTNRMRAYERLPFEDDSVDVARHSLHGLFEVLSKKRDEGKKILVVHSPTAFELHGRETEHTRAVQRILSDSGLEVLDLHEFVSQNYSRDVYYRDAVHLDRRGHQLYAQAIAARLAEMLNR